MDSNNMQERGDGGQQRKGGFFRRGGGENRPSESPSQPSGPSETQPHITHEEVRREQIQPAESSEGKLNFTQVAKSTDRIVYAFNPNEGLISQHVKIQPYRDYTLVISYGRAHVNFFDKNGMQTESPRNEFGVNGRLEGSLDDLAVQGEDRYIIFSEDIASNKYIAYQTKNDQGVELSPRNWEMYSWFEYRHGGNVPKYIKDAIDNARQFEYFTFAQEVGGYNVVIPPDSIAVVKKGESIRNPEFTDMVSGVNNNICLDPNSRGVIYYCATDRPSSIFELDTTKEPSAWQTEAADIPKMYKSIRNLRVDPTGNYFTFDSNGEFVVLDHDTLQEVQKIPKLYGGILGDDGKVRGVDEKGYLVIYDANFQEVAQEAEKRRLARLAQGLASDLFRKEGEAEPSKVDTDQYQHLVPAKTDIETQFNDQLQIVDSLDKVSDITQALTRLKSRFSGEGLKSDQIDFITGGISDSIRDKERVLAAPVIESGISGLDAKLSSGNISLATIAEARADLNELKSLEGLAGEDTRSKINTLETRLGEQSAELFRTQGTAIVEQANGFVAGVQNELEQMTSMPVFADFQEYKLPQLLSRLGSLARDCPLEATEIQSAILAARRQIQDISRQYEERFKEHYVQVREKASEIMGERVELLKTDVESFLDRLRGRGFKDRNQAETYMRSSESLGLLRGEIEDLKAQNPDTWHEFDRYLKVQIANMMFQIERGGLTTIAETGQQMELFGKTLFPKWEGHVKEKTQKKVDLIFIAEERSKGAGIPPDKIYGDVGFSVINSRGEMEKVRLYEGWEKEDAVRYGIEQLVPPSYVNYAEFGKIRKDYNDWKLGENSEIKKSLDEKSQAVREVRKKLREAKDKGQVEETLREEYKKILGDYLNFYGERHISILHRIDRVKNAPESEYENGKGFVPEWQSHWVTDEQTEEYLEDMAGTLKMQLDLQEGLLNLKGHAGSGKDVLIKMFANRTNRPYFAIDCSKWTTEFELSEDVMLESKEGASQTVKVPSVVLNGITTPGAVMYFNEINAMTEQAQIFLHGLMDEKRTLTLKTSSGKSVRAQDSVVLVGSMNPGYPGTFNPQFATKSRMVGIEIDYPPLYTEKDPSDPNLNPPINASEPLRIARSVDSLADFTYEANPEHNEFVKIWDKEVNGIENDAPQLNQTQKFDLEVILALTQFANKLREGFKLKFEKARASSTRGVLLVDQPITGREMRRCAYTLSKMQADEKATANPEAVARELLERFFLTHIDNREERNDVRTAMATWTSSKRPSA